MLRIISRKWNRNTATTATKHREVYVRTREMLMQIWCRWRCLENNERKRYEMVWQQQCEQQHLTNFELYGKHTWNIWPSFFVWSPYYGHEIVCACFFFSLLIVSTKFSWKLSIASIRQQSMIQAIQQIIDYTFYTHTKYICDYIRETCDNILSITSISPVFSLFLFVAADAIGILKLEKNGNSLHKPRKEKREKRLTTGEMNRERWMGCV